jgi:phenylalanyl-tRNA synthetase alpha chain
MKVSKIVESLSPNEVKILPYLAEKNIADICKRSNLDKVSVLRALEYLQNKGLVKISYEKRKIVDLGINGLLYKKKGLPERRLLNLLFKKKIIDLSGGAKLSGLSDNEFKASLGALKQKAMIELKRGKIIFNSDSKEISKKSLEELFIESLPLAYDSLSPEQLYAFKSLQNRKEIVQISDESSVSLNITPLGREIMGVGVKNGELIEQISPELLKKDSLWKGKKFRRYDVTSPVPMISGGKRHFVNQAIDYGRKVWTEMGFKEMKGDMVQSSFWNFDALFTAQDHPVREIHDTFFINQKAELPDKKLVESVRESHEKGLFGSTGWNYKWDENEARKMCLRTHTTCLSAQTLFSLKEKDFPCKFFAIGQNFRNETIDWSHSFEFLQTEGIVVDPDVNFRHLLGYLKQFAKKMGFEKVRFRPAYFPYTEPSLEGDVWNEEKQEWEELLAAGIFRPEVTGPLLGKPVPVLAWGPGFGRMLMKMFEIKDIRELHKNNLTQLRKMKLLVKR